MKLINNLTQKKLFVYFFSLFCIGTLIISYIYKINLSNLFGSVEPSPFLLQFNIYVKNGGVVSDLATHWQYIQILREDILNLFSYEMGVDTKLLNYPLHNIIFSQLYFLADDIKKYLFIYFCLSLVIPYLFFLNLSIALKKTSKYLLFLISVLIYILPAFQYSAIWGNNHLTALFFFLIGTLFHLKTRDNNYKKFRYCLISIFFLSLAAYTKQYYAFFFIFVFFEFFAKLKLSSFLKISLFAVFLSIPGIFFLIKNPLLLFGIHNLSITNFGSSILISSSICFFFIFPFIAQYILNNFQNFKNIFRKLFNLKIFLTSLLIFIICLPYFYYLGNIGGGLFYKLFTLFLNQKYIFFILSFFGIYFIFFFTQKNFYNFILSILLLCTFSSGYFIFQKYFEPMFLIIFLLFFDKNKIESCLKKNNFIIIFYYSSYYLFLNYIYLFGL